MPHSTLLKFSAFRLKSAGAVPLVGVNAGRVVHYTGHSRAFIMAALSSPVYSMLYFQQTVAHRVVCLHGPGHALPRGLIDVLIYSVGTFYSVITLNVYQLGEFRLSAFIALTAWVAGIGPRACSWPGPQSGTDTSSRLPNYRGSPPSHPKAYQ